MPQLDIMTFYIQGFSIALTIIYCFFFFYKYFLPSISIALFCRFLLKKQYSIEKRIFKLNLQKLINRLILIYAPIYNSIKQLLFIISTQYNYCFRSMLKSSYFILKKKNLRRIKSFVHTNLL